LVIVAFERLYSTFYPAYFERHSNRAFAFAISIVVGCGTWLYSMACLSNYFVTLTHQEFVPLYNIRTAANAATFEYLMTLTTYSNIFSLVLIFIDLYFNFIRKPPPNPSLAVSYQRAENRRIILTVMPIEFSESAISIIGSIFQMMLGKLITFESPSSRQIFNELLSLPPVFPLFLVIFIEFRVGRARRRSVVIADNAIDHMEQLKKMWE
ncbi:hypothetical protein PMAYCL1PPCAC_25032, partial [Pristionchus mayeri]